MLIDDNRHGMFLTVVCAPFFFVCVSFIPLDCWVVVVVVHAKQFDMTRSVERDGWSE